VRQLNKRQIINPPLFPIKLWNMYESILANKEITNNQCWRNERFINL
jgi:hypothetical protein